MQYSRIFLVILACLSLIFSGCGSSRPALSECAAYVGAGLLTGGAVGYTGAESVSGDSTSAKERAVSTAVAAAAGATVGYALCARVWKQKKELEERFEQLEAQIDQEEEKEQTAVAVDEETTKQKSEASAREPVPGGGENVVDAIDVIDNRAVRLDLNSSLLFNTGETALQPDTYAYLDVLIESLKENPDTEVTIIGHTDNVGRASVNLRLSEERAQTVALYLIENGIGEERLETVGVGESEPVADNATAEGRAKNRRVEIVIVPVEGTA
jgi:outer membrane protein OmpA-like peptidoglycan-associated protein